MQMELSNWNKKGLTWINGELLVVAKDGNNADRFDGIESLAIDDQHSLRYRLARKSAKIVTNFFEWTFISNDLRNQCHEYIGFDLKDFNHQFYSFNQSGIEYVVPALALIKSLIHPRRTQLPRVFKPNFIENIVCMEIFEGEIKISLDCDVLNLGRTRPVAYIHKLFTWFATHRSATAMINSIHRHSRSGRIGIDLPKAIIQAKFLGTQISHVFLVDEIILNQVEPCDNPDIPLSAFDKVINLKENQSSRVSVQFSQREHHPIPLRKDGGLPITRDEWEIVKRELGLSQKYWMQFKYCPQLQLSAILYKLHSNTPWRKTDFGESDWRTAATLYRSLKTTGKFAKIVEVLKHLRSQTIRMEPQGIDD